MWLWAFSITIVTALFTGMHNRRSKLMDRLIDDLSVSIDRQLACQQAYESTQSRLSAYAARYQRMVGTVVTVRNRCGDCEIRIDTEQDFDQLLDLCSDPRNWPEILMCKTYVGQSGCSPEGAKTCDDLLVCIAGSWDINCEQVNQILDQKYSIPKDWHELGCEKSYKLP